MPRSALFGFILAPIVAADAVTTTAGLGMGAREAVPGSAWLLERFGAVTMHIVAAALCGLLVGVVVAARYVRRWWPNVAHVATWGAWTVLCFKAAVVAHNLVVIKEMR